MSAIHITAGKGKGNTFFKKTLGPPRLSQTCPIIRLDSEQALLFLAVGAVKLLVGCNI
jgi:hypothetical protein